MKQLEWTGVMPAITTPFTESGSVDFSFLTRHANWLLDHGCTAIIALGSLGEGATLQFQEKCEILAALVDAVGSRAPVVTAISSLSTPEAVSLAEKAHALGCGGLMVLPPYVHKGPWHEMEAHFDAIIRATPLPCMLYNNPIAYGVDVLPQHIAAFSERHDNLQAWKESSGDCRRITAVRALIGDRLVPCIGLDDMVVEGVAAGAKGWVAGLVNALPLESVALFEAARAGDRDKTFELYRWFLPLLRLDVVPEFVQLIKLVQSQVDMGNERVRPPRTPVRGPDRSRTLALISEHLAHRPSVST